MLKAYSTSAVAAGIGAFASIATNILLARLMGPSAFGILGLTLTITLFALIIGCLGLNEAGARYIARAMGEGAHSDCRAISLIVFIVLAISSLLLTFAMLGLAQYVGNWMASDGVASGLRHFAPFIPAIAGLQWAAMVLKGVGWNVRQVIFENCILQIFIFAFGILAWHLTADPFSVIVAHGIAYLASAIVSALAAVWALKSLPNQGIAWKGVWRELFSQGLPVTLIGISNRIQRRGDAVIIGAVLGDAAVGIYRAAYTLASATRPLRKVTSTFAIHHLARSYGMRRGDLIRSHYDIGVRVSLALTLPVAFLTIGLAEELILLLYGEQYKEGVLVVQLLAVGQIALVAGGPAQALFGALKANWLRMRISLTCAVLTVMLQVLLVNIFGLPGIAFATASGFAILLLSLIWFARDRFENFGAPPLRGVHSAITCATGGFLLDALPVSGILPIALGGAGATALFLFEIKAVKSLAARIQLQEPDTNAASQTQ